MIQRRVNRLQKKKEAWAQMLVKVAAHNAKKTRNDISENGDLIEVPSDESPFVVGTVFDLLPAATRHQHEDMDK